MEYGEEVGYVADCTTLSNSLALSESQFPHLGIRDNSSACVMGVL